MAKYLYEVTETFQHSWVVDAESEVDGFRKINAALSSNSIEIDNAADLMDRKVLLRPIEGETEIEKIEYLSLFDKLADNQN